LKFVSDVAGSFLKFFNALAESFGELRDFPRPEEYQNRAENQNQFASPETQDREHIIHNHSFGTIRYRNPLVKPQKRTKRNKRWSDENGQNSLCGGP
jgi:hypothetical protein